MELQNVSQIFQNPERTISGTSNTVQADDYILLCDTSAGVVDVELLEIPNKFDREYKLYIIDDSGNAATNNITINAPAGHLINGDASLVINKNEGAVILRFVKLGHYAAFGALNATTATSDINIYKDDGTLTAERRLTFGGFNLGFIGTEQFGVGVEPNLVGISTEAGGIDDTNIQMHVAGAIRTDNWYHGRYGLLLHQPIGDGNVMVGIDTGGSMTSGNGMIGIGKNALRDAVDANHCIAIGDNAMRLNASGDRAIAIGSYSLFNCTTASTGTIAIGYNAMYWAEQSGRNIAIGDSAMYNADKGNAGTPSQNVAIGQNALYNMTKNSNIIAIGDDTLENYNDLSTSSRKITAVGWQAANSLVEGTGYACFGHGAGAGGINGSYCAFFGDNSRPISEFGTIENRLGIGYNARVHTDHTAVIGSTRQNDGYYEKLYLGEGQYRDNSDWGGVKGADYTFTISGSDVIPNSADFSNIYGGGFINREAEGEFIITGGSGTGQGVGRTVSIGASLPAAATGVENNPVTKLLEVLGSAMVDQTTNIQIVFDNGGVLTTRKIEVGAVDSGGVGYRQLRILN